MMPTSSYCYSKSRSTPGPSERALTGLSLDWRGKWPTPGPPGKIVTPRPRGIAPIRGVDEVIIEPRGLDE